MSELAASFGLCWSLSWVDDDGRRKIEAESGTSRTGDDDVERTGVRVMSRGDWCFGGGGARLA